MWMDRIVSLLPMKMKGTRRSGLSFHYYVFSVVVSSSVVCLVGGFCLVISNDLFSARLLVTYLSKVDSSPGQYDK